MDNPEKLAHRKEKADKNIFTTHHNYFVFDSKYSVNKS
jgi:hypothetical protein